MPRRAAHGAQPAPEASPIAVTSIASSAFISDSPAMRPEAMGTL